MHHNLYEREENTNTSCTYALGEWVIAPLLIDQGAIQVLRNAVGGGWMSAFLKKSVTEVYGSMLLALRGGWVGVKFPGKKRYVTLEWPQMRLTKTSSQNTRI